MNRPFLDKLKAIFNEAAKPVEVAKPSTGKIDNVKGTIKTAANKALIMVVAVAIIVLAVLCNGALSIILSAVGLFFKAIATVCYAVAALIGAVIEFVVLFVQWIGVKIFGNKS